MSENTRISERPKRGTLATTCQCMRIGVKFRFCNPRDNTTDGRLVCSQISYKYFAHSWIVLKQQTNPKSGSRMQMLVSSLRMRRANGHIDICSPAQNARLDFCAELIRAGCEIVRLLALAAGVGGYTVTQCQDCQESLCLPGSLTGAKACSDIELLSWPGLLDLKDLAS